MDEDRGDPRRQWLACGRGRRILLVDSVTQLVAEDAGAVAVTGSHGGRSAARYALAQPMTLVVFNDAGVGKDGAGMAALALMQRQGCAAATVSHTSARIGDARDAWRHGVLSHLNPAAADLGLASGVSLRVALRAALKRQGPAEAGPSSPGDR